MNNISFNNQKGVTAIVAVVLLAMFSLIMAGGAYAYVSGSLDIFKNLGDSFLNNERTRVIVEDKKCYNGTSKFRISLTNDGETQIKLDEGEIYIYDSQHNTEYRNRDFRKLEGAKFAEPTKTMKPDNITLASSNDVFNNKGEEYRIQFEFGDYTMHEIKCKPNRFISKA